MFIASGSLSVSAPEERNVSSERNISLLRSDIIGREFIYKHVAPPEQRRRLPVMNQRYIGICVTFLLLTSLFAPSIVLAQTEGKSGSHSTRPKGTISAEARALVEEAISQVCSQAKLDPKASMAID